MVELYPHQKKAVDDLDNGKILWGGVGTGKSMVAVAYYMKKEADADVYVITTAKKRDSLEWETEFARVGVGKHLNATLAGSLTVDSWNNLAKYATVRDAFFIFDEQRIVGNGEWTTKFLEIVQRNRWILLSATPGDTWLDYIPVFLANGFYRNRTDFKRQHVVYSPFSRFPKVDRYIDVGRLVRHRNEILVEMEYERHTTRHVKTIWTDHDKEMLGRVEKDRWNVFENRPLRDVADLFRAMRRVVNSNSSRIRMIQTLMKEHPKLIIFYNFNYELEALKTALGSASLGEDGPLIFDLEIGVKPPVADSSSGHGITTKVDFVGSRSTTSTSPTLAIAEWNGKKHQEIPKTDRWVYLVQYAAGAEGWNCVETDAMVFYSLTYSYKQWHQAFGRIDRLNTPFSDLHYYVLMSKTKIDLMIAKALREKKNFNEKKSSEIFGRI